MDTSLSDAPSDHHHLSPSDVPVHTLFSKPSFFATGGQNLLNLVRYLTFQMTKRGSRGRGIGRAKTLLIFRLS